MRRWFRFVCWMALLALGCSRSRDAEPLPLFTIAGTASGIVSRVTLALRHVPRAQRAPEPPPVSETIEVTADGPFAFATRLGTGEDYIVEIFSSGQPCTLASATGTVADADVAVALECEIPALPASLDANFGSSGTFRHCDPDLRVNYAPDSLAVDRSDRIVVGATRGVTQCFGHTCLITNTATVARVTPDGSFDPTFGAGAPVFAPSGDDQLFETLVAVDPAGTVYLTDRVNGIWRYTSEGAVDPTLAAVPEFTGFPKVRIALDDLARLVVTRGVSSGEELSGTLSRYGQDGVPDLALHGTGRVATSIYSPVCIAAARGRMTVAGQLGLGSEFVVQRFDEDGAPTAIFGQAGSATLQAPAGYSLAWMSHCTVDSTDAVIVAGVVRVSSSDPRRVAVWRLLANGALDQAFGDAGVVLLAENGSPAGIAVYDDGRIIVTGTASRPDTGLRAFVQRLAHDGSVDASFGITDYAAFRSVEAMPAAVDNAGRAVVAWTDSAGCLALWRFAP